jgi:serine/threonine protein kinase
MTLAPGARLGLYEVGSPLGAGGTGVVCRARDSKLNRDVDIKILPEADAAPNPATIILNWPQSLAAK